jgi:hypothetical protein
MKNQKGNTSFLLTATLCFFFLTPDTLALVSNALRPWGGKMRKGGKKGGPD